MEFFDRKKEREKFKILVNDLDCKAKLLVIKGVPGSGKTAFFHRRNVSFAIAPKGV